MHTMAYLPTMHSSTMLEAKTKIYHTVELNPIARIKRQKIKISARARKSVDHASMPQKD